jgi:hypothetical protein
MPKNLQGGSKHKKGSNSESSTSKKNKKLFDNLLSDIYDEEDIDGIHIGKVVCGLMEFLKVVNTILVFGIMVYLMENGEIKKNILIYII